MSKYESSSFEAAEVRELEHLVKNLEQENARLKQRLGATETAYDLTEAENERLVEERDRLKAQVERLTAPVTREEWDADYPSMPDGGHSFFDAIIAARAAEPK